MQPNIKYLIGTFKYAKQHNFANEYLFYLQLKGCSDHGLFKKGSYLQSTRLSLNYSEQYISKMFKKLVQIGLVRQLDNNFGYQLISYFDCWRMMGFDWRQSKSKITKANFDIYQDKKTLKLYCQNFELKYQLIKQAKGRAVKAILEDKKMGQKDSHSISVGNKEVATGELSHYTIARDLFGYKSPMSSYQLQSVLEKEGLIAVERNSFTAAYSEALAFAEQKWVEHNQKFQIKDIVKRKLPFSRYCTWIQNGSKPVKTGEKTTPSGQVQVRLCNKITSLL